MLFPSLLPSHFHTTLAFSTLWPKGKVIVNLLEAERGFSSITAVVYLLFLTAFSSKHFLFNFNLRPAISDYDTGGGGEYQFFQRNFQ